MSLTAIMIGGAVLQGVGTLMANSDEAKAHRANAEHAEKMAEYNQLVGDREEEMFRTELQTVLDGQEAATVKSGIDMSGSALVLMADTLSKGQEQIDDIKLKTKMNVDDAKFQASQSRSAAKAATDPLKTVVQLGGIGASTYSSYLGSKGV